MAEVARDPPKSLDLNEKFKPEHTLFCRELRFVAIYALYKASFLNPNIRYFVTILRFVAIYALYKASFRPDSDKIQLSFVQTQTKDSFPSSRLRKKTVSFRLDLNKLQHSFVWTQTRNCSFSSKVKKHLPLVQIQTKLMSQKTAPFVQI